MRNLRRVSVSHRKCRLFKMHLRERFNRSKGLENPLGGQQTPPRHFTQPKMVGFGARGGRGTSEGATHAPHRRRVSAPPVQIAQITPFWFQMLFSLFLIHFSTVLHDLTTVLILFLIPNFMAYFDLDFATFPF